ncbi:MAG: hypothetical protein MZV64_10585 [Ignavibacteriales bacterium]|nr:hypothetical protein [Ignavibacteriales bacterium]
MPKRPKMSSRPWRSSRKCLSAIKYAELLITRQKIPEALAAYDLLLRNEDVLKDREFLFKLALFFAQNGRDGQAVELVRGAAVCIRPAVIGFFLGALRGPARGGRRVHGESIRIALEKYVAGAT